MIDYIKRMLKIKNKVVILHILFWIGHVAYRWTFVISPAVVFNTSFYLFELSVLTIKIAVTYILVYVLIYKFLVKKKFYRFILYMVLTILVSALLHQVLRISMGHFRFAFNWVSFGSSIAQIFPIAILASVITLVRVWYQEQLNNLKMKHEQRIVELNYLKAQIHPHFLFNTINNIYSTAVHTHQKTPRLLLKLSEVLRYIIYETKADSIPLKKEIDMIESYIELEKIRHGDKLKLLINKKGDFSGIRIPPLIFLPLVENSFKHGAAESIENNWVSIDIELSEKKLTFKVENSVEKRNQKKIVSGGFGLENLRRRMKLIYGKNYSLETLSEENSFLSILILDFGT